VPVLLKGVANKLKTKIDDFVSGYETRNLSKNIIFKLPLFFKP
jgi:ribosomal protein S17